jgi:predicted nucleic acid-binding protein
VKRYVAESGSEAVRQLIEEGLCAASRLSEAEVASSLARRCREGEFPERERDRALAALREDFGSLLIVEVTGEVVARGVTLLVRHRLRAADALQLSSCLELRDRLRFPVRFIAYDGRLVEAAGREGLETRS